MASALLLYYDIPLFHELLEGCLLAAVIVDDLSVEKMSSLTREIPLSYAQQRYYIKEADPCRRFLQVQAETLDLEQAAFQFFSSVVYNFYREIF